MEPFRIAVAGWGVFIQIRAPLTNNDRNTFVELLRQARDRVADMDLVGVLIDLREIDVDRDPDERILAYIGMLRLLRAGRAAIVVSWSSSLDRIAAALDSTDMQDITRVLLPGTGTGSALAPALDWVQHGGE